jgi:1-acyl-sn-glycerol-3-phosphate acyltransferase
MQKGFQAIYSAWVMLWFIIIIVLSFPMVLLIMLLPEERRVRWMHQYMRFVGYSWYLASGIRPKTYNKHLLHALNGCVITCNHASYLDAAAIYTAISKVFKTLGKAEIAKAPIFGIAYQTVVVCLDRSNNMARARSMIKMTQMIKQGLDIVIFPEGTFDEIRTDLLPFFDGAFRLAIDSGNNVLPLILVDTAKRMHPQSVWRFTPGVSRTVFLPSVSVAGLVKQHDGDLKDYMYSYMNHMFRFCQTNDCSNAFAEATQWLQKNPMIVPAVAKN